MRVTIASRIFAPEPAAAAFALRSLAERLRDGGADVTVLTSRAPAGFDVAELPGVEVRRAPVLRDRNGYVRGYAQYLSFDVPLFWRLLFGPRADVIFVEPPPTTGVMVRIAAALRRTPYVYDAADIWSDAVRNAGRSSLVARALLALERFALGGAYAAVTISHGVQSRLRELGVRTPVTVTGFGADLDSFRYPPPGDAPDPPYFVYPGSYSSWHGADVLVRGFAAFGHGRPHRLLFVGNGTEQAELAALADELGVGDRVEFRPAVSPAELATILGGATAAVASLRPGAGYDYAFATKAYSALACGCPVVFAGPGPTSDFIREAGDRVGFAVDAQTDAVRDALAEFANHPRSQEQRRWIAEWTARECSLGAVADRIRDVIEAVAAKGAP